MLIPAAILAALCIIWGLSQPLVVSFLHAEIEVTLLEAFTTAEFPIFMGLLLPTIHTGLLLATTKASKASETSQQAKTHSPHY